MLFILCNNFRAISKIIAMMDLIENSRKGQVEIGFKDKRKSMDCFYFEVKRPDITSKYISSRRRFREIAKAIKIFVGIQVQLNISSQVSAGVCVKVIQDTICEFARFSDLLFTYQDKTKQLQLGIKIFGNRFFPSYIDNVVMANMVSWSEWIAPFMDKHLSAFVGQYKLLFARILLRLIRASPSKDILIYCTQILKK